MGQAKRPTGRPPRTDRPVRVTIMLPSVVRDRVRGEARRMSIPEGNLVAVLILRHFFEDEVLHGHSRSGAPRDAQRTRMLRRLYDRLLMKPKLQRSMDEIAALGEDEPARYPKGFER